jgi:hypothetical protein
MPSLADPASPPTKQLLPARRVAERYQVHLGSIGRWVATGIIPPADVIINRRRYWDVETLNRADRQRVVERAAAKGQPATGTAAADQ